MRQLNALMLATILALVSAPIGAQEAAVTPPAAAVETFDILEYRVLGNTALPAREIETAVYPHLGRGRSLVDVENARVALENAYRASGYATVFVDIPEQSVDDGVVRLRASEGRLDRVRVNGARFFSAKKILAALPAVQKGDVPHFPSLQSQLGALNRQTPDRSVTPILKPGLRAGTVDLELRVKDELPIHGGVEINDRYTADTSRLRLNANLTYNNLFDKLHAIALQYQISPEEPSEVDVIAATYTIPFGERGAALALSAIRSDTNVAALGTLGVLGKGNIFGLRALWPFEARAWSHTFSVGVDLKDVAEIIRPGASSNAAPGDPILRPVEYLNWSLSHSALRRAEKATTLLSFGASFGSRRVLNDAEEFNRKRFLAQPNYFYVRSSASWLRSLPHRWQLRLRASAQYSPSGLISNEQFSIGGLETVRGYLEADQFGDFGAAASAELFTPPLFSARWQRWSLNGLLFYDVGYVGLSGQLLPGQTNGADLAATGLGLRLSNIDGLEASVDWSYPLVPSNAIDAGDDRIHFSFKYSF